MSATSTSITDMPFPSVTICNINKARYSIANQFVSGSSQSAWLQNICMDEYANSTVKNDDVPLREWEKMGEWDSFKQYLLNISQPCSAMLLMCRYALDTFNCMDIFDTNLSDEGICCTFNKAEPKFLFKNPTNASSNFDDDAHSEEFGTPIDWTPEVGYPVNSELKQKSSPRPAAEFCHAILGPGSHLGLYVILDSETSDYYCSSTNSAGFKILLHNPTETPRISDFGLLVAPGRESRITIRPKIQTASHRIRRIPIESRQCIFANEANLSYFRTYSRKNCEMECFSRFVEQVCGCVQYFMPMITQNTKVCNRAESKCYNSVRLSLERGDNAKYTCACLPGCDELSFTGEISSATLTKTNFQLENHLQNFTDEVIRRDVAIVQVFYAESFFRSYVKDELIGVTEFLC
ncbi:pickpocket protein 28-like [Contarinia nasturtii]|uniref:pickpocket protein 28-like n=1 Tax=Contarinia nasturtii TaxID=265458 RepID=UPI0012D453BA|nr:pickpocket protein 28-like [Contarinia nasturtii]